MKLVVLILSSDTYPSKRNKKIIEQTWAKNNSFSTEIYFYFSGSETFLNKNMLSIKDSGIAQDIGYKTINAFEWVSKNLEFDYIFRTNTSSYVNIFNLEDYIKKNCENIEFLYKGILHERKYENSELNYFYVNGAGILLNKKTVSFILDNKDSWDHTEWDDVALGKLMLKSNITPQVGKRYEIVGNFYNNNIPKDNYHIRCRLDQISKYPRYLEKYVLKNTFYIFEKNKNFKYHFFSKYFFYFCRILYLEKPLWKSYNYFFKFLRKILPNSSYEYIRGFKSNRIYKLVLKYYQIEPKDK